MNETQNLTCEYCNKTFSKFSNLKHHKMTTKYCLNIQNTNNNTNIVNNKFNCDYCNKVLSTKFSLKNHLETCIEKMKKELLKIIEDKDKEFNKIIKEKDKQIQEKNNEILKIIEERDQLKIDLSILKGQNKVYEQEQSCLFKIAQQAKNTTNTTNNNITNNLAIYDTDLITNRFQSALNNMTTEDIYDGQIAVSKIVAPCLINEDGTKLMTCTDKSRCVFAIKDVNGNINKDLKGRNLVSVIEPLATKKVDEIVNLDYEKKNKSRHLSSLKKDIIKRNQEIENLEDTLRGIQKDTFEWNKIKKQINDKKYRNDEDYEQINIYVQEGIQEFDDDNCFDERLINGALNIKEMKVDSTKFSNSLAKLL